MNRPEQLQIFNITYTVHWEEVKAHGLDGVWGLCVPDRQAITMFTPAPDEVLAETFLHEIIHAINWYHWREDVPTEEQFTRGAAAGLIKVWQDNPEAFAWWLELQGFIEEPQTEPDTTCDDQDNQRVPVEKPVET